VTGRAASLDAVDRALLRGHIALRGFRLADRAGEPAPFATFSRLDLHLRWLPLLRGHVWLDELVLRDPSVEVIRYPGDDFNVSDLVRPSGDTPRALGITVDRFELVNGTGTLEDRAVPEPKVWRSEQITLEAHDLSTAPQHGYGTAVATSVISGTPISVKADRLRLDPVDLQASVTVDGLDLALARVYLPSNAPVMLDRGRVSASLRVAFDAPEGLRLDATARADDVILTRSDGEA